MACLEDDQLAFPTAGELNSTGDHILTCGFCFKTLSSRRQYRDHLAQHTKPHHCQFCGRGFARTTTLQSHMKIHLSGFDVSVNNDLQVDNTASTDDGQQSSDKSEESMDDNLSAKRTFTCEFCSKTFDSRGQHTVHVRQHTRPHHCDICGRGFGKRNTMINHRKTHFDEKEFQCNLCGHSYTLRTQLTKHIADAHASDGEPCNVCGEHFRSIMLLTRHQKYYCVNSFKPDVNLAETYVCPDCGKSFATEWELDNHKKYHERDFKCAFCDKSFIQRYLLLGHLLSAHYNVRPYHCLVCDSSFSLRHTCQRHCGKHLIPQTFKCTSCPFMFRFNEEYHSHITKNLCGQVEIDVALPDLRKLMKHDKPDFNSLGISPEMLGYSSTSDVNNDLDGSHGDSKQNKGKRRSACNVCGAVVKKLGSHMAHVHGQKLNPENYRCYICGEKFVTEPEVRSHIKKHLPSSSSEPDRCQRCDASSSGSQCSLKNQTCCQMVIKQEPLQAGDASEEKLTRHESDSAASSVNHNCVDRGESVRLGLGRDIVKNSCSGVSSNDARNQVDNNRESDSVRCLGFHDRVKFNNSLDNSDTAIVSGGVGSDAVEMSSVSSRGTIDSNLPYSSDMLQQALFCRIRCPELTTCADECSQHSSNSDSTIDDEDNDDDDDDDNISNSSSPPLPSEMHDLSNHEIKSEPSFGDDDDDDPELDMQQPNQTDDILKMPLKVCALNDDTGLEQIDVNGIPLSSWMDAAVAASRRGELGQRNGQFQGWCEICQKYIKNHSKYRTHLQRHSDERPFPCDECGKSYKTTEDLNTHRRTHQPQRVVACNVCGQQIKASAWRQHKFYHTGLMPYECGTCGKQFRRRGYLTIHERMHTGETPYSCDVCGRQFRIRSSLDDHYKTHTGAKPYACRICNKQFSQRGNWRTHERRHQDSSNRAFKCEKCNKTFVQNYELQNHRQRCVTAEFPFTCLLCGMKFIKETPLKRHLGRHSCSVCKTQFVDMKEKVTHQLRCRTRQASTTTEVAVIGSPSNGSSTTTVQTTVV